MAEKEFNLLREPWIRVMGTDCAVKEVSLTDALLRAHEYRELAGELPTQNAAVLRLLLAVLHAVFERVDADGEAAEIEDADDALDRWSSLWEGGRFPEEPLRAYLEAQQENFWLFHPTRPFWQIGAAKIGTAYEAAKLNGSLSESSNKIRLFPERTGAEKTVLTYSEAARWLLYVNAFDDTSAKPTKAGKAEADGKLPSPGAGWLGKIGLVSLVGDNLFETLMLNLVLLDENKEPWTSAVPAWELDSPRSKERTEIPVPHDQAALLTLQSRRLLLHREDDCVTGYSLLGGDFFPKENAFVEQMTVWGPVKDGKGAVVGYQPRRHDKTRQMWRDFSSFVPTGTGIPKPGVIEWNAYLQYQQILSPERMLCVSIASVQYGDKDFFMADLYSDSLSLHQNLLSDVGEVYRQLIADEIERCDKVAGYVGTLAKDLFLASGGDTEKTAEPMQSARERFYYAIDMPFREWLSALDAEGTPQERDRKCAEWRETADRIARKLAEKMVADAGRNAFIGKMVSVRKDRKEYCSSSLAMQKFQYNLKKYT